MVRNCSCALAAYRGEQVCETCAERNAPEQTSTWRRRLYWVIRPPQLIEETVPLFDPGTPELI